MSSIVNTTILIDLPKDLIIKIVGHMLNCNNPFISIGESHNIILKNILCFALSCRRTIFLLCYRYRYLHVEKYTECLSTYSLILWTDSKKSYKGDRFIRDGISLTIGRNDYIDLAYHGVEKNLSKLIDNLMQVFGFIILGYKYFINDNWKNSFSFYERIHSHRTNLYIDNICVGFDANAEYSDLIYRYSKKFLVKKKMPDISKYLVEGDCYFLVVKD